MVEATRLKFYDYLMLSSPKQSEQIVVANIGEKALEKYGQYPFPRASIRNTPFLEHNPLQQAFHNPF